MIDPNKVAGFAEGKANPAMPAQKNFYACYRFLI